MKKFKLNGFEKFVIRNRKVLLIADFATFFILNIIASYFEIPFGTTACGVIFFASWMYISMLAAVKNNKIVRFQNEEMDMVSAIDGINKLLDTVDPKDQNFAALYCSNRIAFLINLGEFRKAEEEVKMFFNTFDLKKVSSFTMFVFHTNYATLKLHYEDAAGYNEQLKIVYAYHSKLKNMPGMSKKNIAFADNRLFSLLNEAESVFGEYNPYFEQKVLDGLNFLGQKKRKKEPMPYEYFGVYSELFYYFKRFNNAEKAEYYAKALTQIGNEQLYDYRVAKEYLENENRDN